MFRKRVELAGFLKSVQNAVDSMVTASRDFWLNEAETAASETLPLPGDPSGLSMMPQQILQPNKVMLDIDAGDFKIDGVKLSGRLELTWKLEEAPELTARLRDGDLALLDGTIDNGVIKGWRDQRKPPDESTD